MDVKKFRRLPIIGIVRGIEQGLVEPLVDTVIAAGLQTLEITMNTRGAPKLIRRAARRAKGRLAIGAGTVLDTGLLRQALDAGATFIVMPALIESVMKSCVKGKIPVFPGALTPQEIYAAWSSGATMVKVFPSGIFGPAYFKEIKAPFEGIELLACGGVSPENIASYFSNGASAAAFGASVFRNEWLAGRDFASIKGAVENFIAAYRNIRT